MQGTTGGWGLPGTIATTILNGLFAVCLVALLLIVGWEIWWTVWGKRSRGVRDQERARRRAGMGRTSNGLRHASRRTRGGG